MPYRHPGKSFLAQYPAVQEKNDVLQYVRFLRDAAGAGPEEPLDLDRVFQVFEMPAPKLAPLPDIQGLLLLPDAGLMVINDSDIAARQRFTQAHELIELLFDALPDGKSWRRGRKGPFKHHTKENLCDIAAADLLMPPPAFRHAANQKGVSFSTARFMAGAFSVSTTAALVQLVRCSAGRLSVALWAMGLKKSENNQAAGQISFLPPEFDSRPAKKLRVVWAFGSPANPLVPRNKSAGEGNTIQLAYQSGAFESGNDFMDLGTFAGTFRIEALPFEDKGERRVLSLLEYLG